MLTYIDGELMFTKMLNNQCASLDIIRYAYTGFLNTKLTAE